ncbi:MAG TPA: TonB-dependent receptor [Thermoanaerobaculia bacterium]|nr:TonB-dependent receptor [Thermoanaerobaculia bacterium]
MIRTRNLRSICLFVLLAILVPFAGFAQSTTGSISGNATDASGSALPGVTITATNAATGASRTVASNGSGHYEIALLPPATYRVVADLSGFQQVQAALTINVGSTVTFDVKMKPAAAETVTVTAAAPLIDPAKSEISSVVNEKAIQSLPTNGRNFIDFVLTTPGVVRDVRLGDISFAGQRGTMNSMVVDGANNDNTFFGQTVGRTGSGRAPYQFSEDAVKEFQVNANSYSAEYGRAGGAVINVVTKSGTNDFHGSAFDYYRDKSLNANNYINEINNRPKSPYHFDQYGFTAGGPIVRDKHFFFVNGDFQRNSSPNLVVLGGGRIPNFPTDPASQAAIQFLTPLAQEYPQQLHQDVYLIKTDHELSNTQHLSLRYNRQRFLGVNFENGSITNSVQHTGDSDVFTDSLSAVHDMTISNNLFNEVRAQYLKDREPGEANDADPEAQIFQGGNAVINIGRNTFSPRETTIKRYQIADTATYVLNAHTLKAGFDYNHDNILNYFPGNFFGSYRFNSLADFTNKTAASFTQAFPGPGTTGPITNPNLKETGLFVQDEWHVRPNWTVNAGLRYDRQDVAQPTVLNPDAQLLAAGYTTNKIPVDGNNIGPRLGIAWTPTQDGRTVVRAGYGIFYGRTPSIMYGTAMSNNGINVQTITFTGNLIPTYPAIYTSLPTGATLPKPTIFVFDQHFQNPRVQQANLGVEQQLGNDYAVGLTYQFVKGDDLPRSRDINEATPVPTTVSLSTGGTVTINKYTTRPFSDFNRVIAFESSARSKYNGITLDLQRRFTTNWQARLSWTHATVKDDRPDATAVVPFSSGDDAKYASDPLNLEHDYTFGDNDVRDRVVLSGVWTLNDYAKNLSGVSKALAEGWSISAIAFYQTGQPYSPKVNADLLNDGNPSNDIAPGFLRNSFRLPTTFEVDPRVTRDIGVFGSAKIQLIAEAFNVFNRHNVSSVNNTYYSYNATTNTLSPLSTFGVPTATAGQRIMQLAAKVTF